MNWIDNFNETDECATIERCKISRLFFCDDLVLLSSPEFGLQHTLLALQLHVNCWNENQHFQSIFFRNPIQCFLQVGGVSLNQVEKFKYLVVTFTSDGKQDEEFDV